jgi:hypothetical protein
MTENRTIWLAGLHRITRETPAESPLNVEHQNLSEIELAIIRGDLGDPVVGWIP